MSYENFGFKKPEVKKDEETSVESSENNLEKSESGEIKIDEQEILNNSILSVAEELAEDVKELDKEVAELGGEENVEKVIAGMDEAEVKSLMDKFKDQFDDISRKAKLVSKYAAGNALALAFSLSPMLMATHDKGGVGAYVFAGGISAVAMLMFNGGVSYAISESEKERKAAVEKTNEWKKEHWENPKNPEAVYEGILEFNRNGLKVEYKDGTVIKGKIMDKGLRSFHQKGYNAHYSEEYRFSGHRNISNDENTQVIRLRYSHSVPEGGDFAAYSSYMDAIIDKKNKTIDFVDAGGGVTS